MSGRGRKENRTFYAWFAPQTHPVFYSTDDRGRLRELESATLAINAAAVRFEYYIGTGERTQADGDLSRRNAKFQSASFGNLQPSWRRGEVDGSVNAY